MNSSDFRAEARQNLSGKWGTAVIITLAYIAINLLISFIEGMVPENFAFFVSLVVLLIDIPLSYGLTSSFLKLYKNESTSSFDFLQLGFQNFSKAWGIFLRILLKMILPILLLIISIMVIVAGYVGSSSLSANSLLSGNIEIPNEMFSFSAVSLCGLVLYFVSIIWLIVRSYTYQLSTIIAIDDENISAKDAVEKSAVLMNGNRFKLFCLQLSFIGWIVLAMFTLGIGYLWLVPYIQFATFAFYYFLNKENF